MKITGKNAAVGQTAEDIINAGGTFSEPTEARIHALASTDTQDDAGGVLQVETATVVGTIVGINQVETQTIVGTIGVAGAGNALVTITSALLEEPLEIPVAVANNDTASQLATKIRAALNLVADITDNYTVGGTGADITLTTKVKAANDTTLNIAFDNDTCTGLTGDSSSVNTTAGHAGTGNAAVVVTGADIQDSPITLAVAVVAGDTPALVAGKIRSNLLLNAKITAVYNIGGTNATVSLIRKVQAANDATLNISIDNGTCNGLTTAASSADTTAGLAGTGAHYVRCEGPNELDREIVELVALNGTANVLMKNKFKFFNVFEVENAGLGGKNAGVLTLTAQTDNTISGQIEIGKNKMQYATHCTTRKRKIKAFLASAYNSTAGAQTTVEMLTKKAGEGWKPKISFDLNSSVPNLFDPEGVLFEELEQNTMVKFQAVASAGSSAVTINFEVN